MRRTLIIINCIIMMVAMWVGLTYGQVNTIPLNMLYSHVPSSITALLCFVVLLIASIAYLKTSNPKWDNVAYASAEVGTVFAAILNITGSIFSRSEWGMWWTPSPRLVTAAILLFLYIVYLILRNSIPGSKHKRARVCAVFGIIAFLDVPMVLISARFLKNDMHIGNVSLSTGAQRLAFGLSILATLLLAGLLIWLRVDLTKCNSQLEKQLSLE